MTVLYKRLGDFITAKVKIQNEENKQAVVYLDGWYYDYNINRWVLINRPPQSVKVTLSPNQLRDVYFSMRATVTGNLYVGVTVYDELGKPITTYSETGNEICFIDGAYVSVGLTELKLGTKVINCDIPSSYSKQRFSYGESIYVLYRADNVNITETPARILFTVYREKLDVNNNPYCEIVHQAWVSWSTGYYDYKCSYCQFSASSLGKGKYYAIITSEISPFVDIKVRTFEVV